MPTARALQPQDRIAHYRIIGPLGAGGMGEVYLAEDQTLERSVALKILPPELVRSEERVRRFVREAKSASSLNHPNIVTIYEIGHDEIRPSEGVSEPGSTSVHFISMELVSGETLSTKIHEDRADLRTLVGFLAQAAEGLAKAHLAGIVHRDLKPSNIMISKDGYAKVLDFGLAKLTEKQSNDLDVTSGATVAQDGTSVGAVVGTVGYMSPEQVRGGVVDHRSDIFSFGCILYEAATRTKPFAAESSVETMHRILHDKPVPVEERNKEVPAELRRVIRRCLAKNPDQRFQSAKDLAIELREIVEEYDSLSPSGSGSGSSGSAAALAGPDRKKVPAGILIGGAVVLAALIVSGALLFRRDGGSAGSAGTPALKVSTATSRGNINGAALSPDGRYLAYSQFLDGQRSIWIRQVATGSDVQVLPPPQTTPPTGLTFTPDGNYLFYLSADPERTGYTALFDLPTLGGTPRKRAYDVDSRAAFSPQGTSVCFRRGVPTKNQDLLVVFDLEKREERTLATATRPLGFGQSSWSPDGKWIAVAETNSGTSLGAAVVAYRVEDGRREPVGTNTWLTITDLCWLPDSRGLLVSAFDPASFSAGQLWILHYPGGRIERVTNDGSLYADLSVSSDGSTIGAVRTRREANLWVASITGDRAVRQITFGSADEGAVGSFSPGPDGTILFSTVRNGSARIFSVGMDGTGERAVTQEEKVTINPHFRPGVGVIYEQAAEDYARHIWVADPNGENPRQVTSGREEHIVGVSPDGSFVLFHRDNLHDIVWGVSTKGGEPARLMEASDQGVVFSPDGSRFLTSEVQEVAGQPDFVPVIASLREPDKKTNVTGLPPRSYDERWSPDGKDLTFLHAFGNPNLQRLTLDGGATEAVTRFTEGRVISHRWSPDGKRILLLRRMDNVDNLWVVQADGSGAMAVTDFETGTIDNMDWSPDGSRAIFTYGTSTQNVILIRNFRPTRS